MRVLALAGDIGALIAQIRLVVPLGALCSQRGWTLALRSFHDCARADLALADVLVVQRAGTARVLRLMQHLQHRGGAVVYDIDDLLTEVPPHISNQAAVQQRVALLRRCLAQADAVSVSTERLGRELGLEDSCVVPNQAWQGADQPLPLQQPGEPVTLLFASSDRLAADFLYPALRDLPGTRLVVVGPPAEDFRGAGLQVQAHPLMPREHFVAFARSLANPLAVIPLEDSRFAACKSAVKWFDYAEAGVPTLCSDVSPYREVIQQGVTAGLVANDPAAWRQALQAAVADAAWRSRVAGAARQDVRSHHTLQHTVDAWAQALQHAVVHRQAAPPPAAGSLWHAREAAAGWFEGAGLRLRAFNRARLAKRARR